MTEPTTKAGKALAARAKREAWGNWEGLAQFGIPAIEAGAVTEWLRSEEAEQRLAEALPHALSALTEGSEYAVAPEPSDEPGSPYVEALAHAILAALQERP